MEPKPTKRRLQLVKRLQKVLAKLDMPFDDPFLKRFEAHFPRSDDSLTVVLRAHLLAEELLYEIVELFARNPRALEQARLSFAQLLALTKALTPFPDDHWMWACMSDLNAIRNRMAHNLESGDLEANIERLRLTLLSRSSAAGAESSNVPTSLKGQLAFLLGVLSTHRRILAEARRINAVDLLEGFGRTKPS